jgi:hypothetical protein
MTQAVTGLSLQSISFKKCSTPNDLCGGQSNTGTTSDPSASVCTNYTYHSTSVPNVHFYRILPSCALLCVVRWFETDVSGVPISPMFKVQDVMPHDNPEDKRIQFKRGRSLQFRISSQSNITDSTTT